MQASCFRQSTLVLCLFTKLTWLSSRHEEYPPCFDMIRFNSRSWRLGSTYDSDSFLSHSALGGESWCLEEPDEEDCMSSICTILKYNGLLIIVCSSLSLRTTKQWFYHLVRAHTFCRLNMSLFFVTFLRSRTIPRRVSTMAQDPHLSPPACVHHHDHVHREALQSSAQLCSLPSKQSSAEDVPGASRTTCWHQRPFLTFLCLAPARPCPPDIVLRQSNFAW